MKEFKFTRIFLAFLTFAGMVMLSFSCDDNPAFEEEAASKIYIEKLSGDHQTERIGMTLPQKMTVHVINLAGNHLPGRLVNFSTSDTGAVVTPRTAITDNYGIAECSFTLGTRAGEQHVGAATRDDSTTFTAIAEEIGCSEENPQPCCNWPAGMIYITTTSSSLIEGSGSVLIMFDPATGGIEKILETDSTIADLSFSSRGELFLSTRHTIMKVDHETYQLENFCSYPSGWIPELISNPGGVMVGLSEDEIFMVGCPPDPVRNITDVGNTINIGNLAISIKERNLFIIMGSGPTYKMKELNWDGRTVNYSLKDNFYLNCGTASPEGMCADSTGNVYITLNGTQTIRRIARVSDSGDVDEQFFDFYQHAGGNNIQAGQWGDITLMDGNLYLIDKRNDRLVIISEEGEWIDSVEDHAFSKAGIENERYGIASPPHHTSCP